ncbi:MAG: GTPase HflX [gamma proteobacterium symbiont of Ctena orbiculata]|nr:GTPase HflX [Candidatus Thiodiazotropha taylori]MBT3059203.1 GTPase HflX [Candidatus Thiodiazotropha sp. (ex Lucina pensylvanica)]MBV2094151.1 GTPase HflX [Candidatus Thiodiazotropha sp. (ex Codakia orbicularis)]PUB71804.1 MAG: GTPase HflX [gamma proteobacterium symbiont of Ctena orbiculata]MBT3061628.1 GTPase HflX [Candidatus Thiodiazotropha sp. (ex Lucina pensylvanica)]
MFERPKAGERAVLVHLDLGAARDQDEIDEFRDLALSAGADPITLVSGSRQQPDPKLFVGRGKAEEIKRIVALEGADLVIFDHTLSPSQERNLEREFNCRVVDRTGLILDIFSQRARSFEGKLQVELAQLQHLSTRLVRGWTHLERQKGGIGLRGPGETQLESDRRLLNQRIHQIRRRLERVDSQREQGRRGRERADIPTVSLVGYTNAGKSTLFNRLVGSSVYAADQLFATLDPTLRRLELKAEGAVVLADTVGFISNLPHDLVAAFKSTLQETTDASLLLHVVDASSHQRATCITEVNDVLRQIGADKVHQIEIFNKTDLLVNAEPRIERDSEGQIRRIWLSAVTGDGTDLLLEALAEYFRKNHVKQRLRLNPGDGRLHALLFQRGSVLNESSTDEGGWEMDIDMPEREFLRLLKEEPVLQDCIIG